MLRRLKERLRENEFGSFQVDEVAQVNTRVSVA